MQYIDIDSTYRDRSQFPNPAQFEVFRKQNTACCTSSGGLCAAVDPVSSQLPLYPPVNASTVAAVFDPRAQGVVLTDNHGTMFSVLGADPTTVFLDPYVIRSTDQDSLQISDDPSYPLGYIPLGQTNQFYTGNVLQHVATGETRTIVDFRYTESLNQVLQTGTMVSVTNNIDGTSTVTVSLDSVTAIVSDLPNAYRGKYLRVGSSRGLITRYEVTLTSGLFTLANPVSGAGPGVLFDITTDETWVATIDAAFTDPLPVYPCLSQARAVSNNTPKLTTVNDFTNDVFPSAITAIEALVLSNGATVLAVGGTGGVRVYTTLHADQATTPTLVFEDLTVDASFGIGLGERQGFEPLTNVYQGLNDGKSFVFLISKGVGVGYTYAYADINALQVWTSATSTYNSIPVNYGVFLPTPMWIEVGNDPAIQPFYFVYTSDGGTDDLNVGCLPTVEATFALVNNTSYFFGSELVSQQEPDVAAIVDRTHATTFNFLRDGSSPRVLVVDSNGTALTVLASVFLVTPVGVFTASTLGTLATTVINQGATQVFLLLATVQTANIDVMQQLWIMDATATNLVPPFTLKNVMPGNIYTNADVLAIEMAVIRGSDPLNDGGGRIVVATSFSSASFDGVYYYESVRTVQEMVDNPPANEDETTALVPVRLGVNPTHLTMLTSSIALDRGLAPSNEETPIFFFPNTGSGSNTITRAQTVDTGGVGTCAPFLIRGEILSVFGTPQQMLVLSPTSVYVSPTTPQFSSIAACQYLRLVTTPLLTNLASEPLVQLVTRIQEVDATGTVLTLRDPIPGLVPATYAFPNNLEELYRFDNPANLGEDTSGNVGRDLTVVGTAAGYATTPEFLAAYNAAYPINPLTTYNLDLPDFVWFDVVVGTTTVAQANAVGLLPFLYPGAPITVQATVAFWVNMSNVYVYLEVQDSGTGLYDTYIQIYLAAEGEWVVKMASDNGGSPLSLMMSGALFPASGVDVEWVHLALVLTTTEIRFYANGIQVQSLPYPFSYSIGGSNIDRIRVINTRRQTALGLAFTPPDYHLMKDFVITSEALSEDEIRTLMMLGQNVSQPLSFEVYTDLTENYSDLNYVGVAFQEKQCVEMELTHLILPNADVKTGFGDRIAFYPYVYVQFANTIECRAPHFASNNPSANKNVVLFKVPIRDLNTPDRSLFVNNTSGMRVRTTFDPTKHYIFSVFLPNGEVLEFVDSDTQPPEPPTFRLQVSVTIGFRVL